MIDGIASIVLIFMPNAAQGWALELASVQLIPVRFVSTTLQGMQSECACCLPIMQA